MRNQSALIFVALIIAVAVFVVIPSSSRMFVYKKGGHHFAAFSYRSFINLYVFILLNLNRNKYAMI